MIKTAALLQHMLNIHYHCGMENDFFNTMYSNIVKDLLTEEEKQKSHYSHWWDEYPNEIFVKKIENGFFITASTVEANNFLIDLNKYIKTIKIKINF